MKKAATFGATLAAIFAVSVGLFLSPIPTRLGFYRWLSTRIPRSIGMSPAFNYGVEWGYSFEELYGVDLTGQTALVTGANSGIGYEISLALARLGASVTMACRNPNKCDKAAKQIQSDKRFKGSVTPMIVDISSLQNVRTFAKSFLEVNKRLDMLYLNAGISAQQEMGDKTFPQSEDDIELTFATNVVGHHLLYKLIEPAVMKSSMARIILTSSGSSFSTFDYGVATDLKTLNGVHVDSWAPQYVYGQSKLAQILWAKHLSSRLGATSDIFVNAANPGAVSTGIFDKYPSMPDWFHKVITNMRRVMWTAEEGALTLLYLGVATEDLKEKNIRGKYFHPQAVEVVNPMSLDEELQENLWNFCDDLVKDFM